MSWLTGLIWGKKDPPPYRPAEGHDEFEMVGYEIDAKLIEQTTSHHPQEKNLFFDAIKQTFHLSHVSDLQAGEQSKAFEVKLHRGQVEEPMILQMIRIDAIDDHDEVHRNFSLSGDSIGIDWQLFLPKASPLPQPEYAIAWNIDKRKFIVLSKGEINDHYLGIKHIDGEHILYATLTPYQSGKTPRYDHPLLPTDTYNTIQPFIPLESPAHFLFILASHLRNLKIDRFLGKGSFSQVWAVTFIDPQGTARKTTLRIPKTGFIENELQKKNYYQISRHRFGGEFGAFLPEGPYSINSYFAIVFDETEKKFRILKRDEIRNLHDDLDQMEDKVYTLFGILGEYHVGAQTLTEVMKAKRKFDIETVRIYAYQLLLALNEFKNLNVIHRDMKPDNVLVLSNGNLKVFDFGLAATKIQEGEMTHSYLGSPKYMSFEILEQDSYDHSVDRYAVYCILFEMATGEHPFPDVRTMEQLKGAVKQKIDPAKDPRLTGFDSAFRNFLSRLGHQRREERWEGDKILQEDEFLQGIPARVREVPHESSLPFILTSILPLSNSSRRPSGPTPSLTGRVAKLVVFAGIAFVLYHIARRILILASRPNFPKGKPL